MIIDLGNLLLIENDSHHKSNVIKTIYDLKTGAFTQHFPNKTTGGYGGTAVNHPVVDGFIYKHCADGKIRCYDITAQSAPSKKEYTGITKMIGGCQQFKTRVTSFILKR